MNKSLFRVASFLIFVFAILLNFKSYAYDDYGKLSDIYDDNGSKTFSIFCLVIFFLLIIYGAIYSKFKKK